MLDIGKKILYFFWEVALNRNGLVLLKGLGMAQKKENLNYFENKEIEIL